MPLQLISKSEEANNQFIKTLREFELRPNRGLEIDRRPIYSKNGSCVLKTFAGEELFIKGIEKNCNGLVSVRAIFSDQNTIHVVEMHRHWGRFRDMLSYLGLLLIGFYWFRCLKMMFISNSSQNLSH
jgi:hypothetical protein